MSLFKPEDFSCLIYPEECAEKANSIHDGRCPYKARGIEDANGNEYGLISNEEASTFVAKVLAPNEILNDIVWVEENNSPNSTQKASTSIDPKEQHGA